MLSSPEREIEKLDHPAPDKAFPYVKSAHRATRM
jgi:hypothetical protein